MVFQDRNWTARPWLIEDEDVSTSSDGFRVRVLARGAFDARDFTWQGTFLGEANGRVEVHIEGSTTSAFVRNRLGLCILHPASASADPVVVEHVDGSRTQAAFPDAISPDQPFLDMRALTHHLRPGLQATIRMEGDVFESEDHRNWSDASFKHYCTPISLPFPVVVHPGEVVRQSVTLTVDGDLHADADADTDIDNDNDNHLDSPDVRIDIGSERIGLPELGIQLDADGHRLTTDEIARLRELRLAHARVDLFPEDGPERLEAALHDADAIGAQLVAALIGADPSAFKGFRDDPRIDHWLAFDPGTKVTDPTLVEQARRVLGPKVGGGTNLYFTELNRGRPSGPEIIAFSVNPQVHAFDDRTVMENAETLGTIARNARALYPKAHLEISPVTLRPRFNPNATEPELDHSNTALPSRVDARQCQPFAAAWTVLSLKAIAESGCIDAVTYYQATGWEGVLERAEGSPQPDDFPSRPGEPFAAYWILRDLADARSCYRCTSSDPGRVDALALESGLVLLANLTPEPQRAVLAGRQVLVPPHDVARIRLEPSPE